MTQNGLQARNATAAHAHPEVRRRGPLQSLEAGNLNICLPISMQNIKIWHKSLDDGGDTLVSIRPPLCCGALRISFDNEYDRIKRSSFVDS